MKRESGENPERTCHCEQISQAMKGKTLQSLETGRRLGGNFCKPGDLPLNRMEQPQVTGLSQRVYGHAVCFSLAYIKPPGCDIQSGFFDISL